MANERICIVCSKKYEYCPNCSGKYNTKEKWRLVYCSNDCKTISDVVGKYVNGHISESEAYELLKGIDLSNKDNFEKTIKDALDKIIPVTPVVTSTPIPTPVVETLEAPILPKKKKQKYNNNIVNDEFKEETTELNHIIEDKIEPQEI